MQGQRYKRFSRGNQGEVQSLCSLLINLQEFKKLHVLEFDSTRKRMSVIVRYPCGRIFLVTKVGSRGRGRREVGEVGESDPRERRLACSPTVWRGRWPLLTGILIDMLWWD